MSAPTMSARPMSAAPMSPSTGDSRFAPGVVGGGSSAPSATPAKAPPKCAPWATRTPAPNSSAKPSTVV